MIRSLTDKICPLAICVLTAAFGLSCNQDDAQLASPSDGGLVRAARAALTTDGLVVHLTPDNIGAIGDAWPDPARQITFTGGAGSARPARVDGVINGFPVLRFS